MCPRLLQTTGGGARVEPLACNEYTRGRAMLGVIFGVMVGMYFMTAMLLVSVGQSWRPVSHLLKATTFWYLVIVAGAGVVLAVTGFWR